MAKGTAISTAQAETPAATTEVSEREIRSFIKSELPKWVRRGSRSFLVEEMEVCAGRARIDLAVIGDHLIGIEIKGPKDDVNRLAAQAQAYSQCFDQVVLVTHDALASKAAALVPEWWGLVIGRLKGCRLRYRFLRRPQPNPSLNLERLLALLWREEIDMLVSELLGASLKASATKKAIRAALIAQIDPSTLRRASLQRLRERSDWRHVPIERIQTTCVRSP